MANIFSFGDANASAATPSASGPAPTSIAIDNGSDGPSATIPDSHLLFTAQFSRAGADLLLTGEDGKAFVVHDYFSADIRARLLSAEGAALSPDVVAALAGPLTPGQYAQAGAAQPAAQAVGRVVQASGDATIVRNGVAMAAQAGQAILKGDVLQTVTGTFGVSFNDGSTLNLTANSRLVVNEFVYDPKGSANSQLLDLVQGSLTFISGEVAHNGDMKIGTPVATMAIRGTVGGVTTANDGTVNFYVSQSATGAVVLDRSGTIIANVVQDGPLIIVRPVGPLQVLAEEVQKSPAQLATELSALQQIVSIQAVGQQIIQQFFQQDPNATPNPNPQSTDKVHTKIQIELPANPTPASSNDHTGDNTAPHQITATVTLITPPTGDGTPTVQHEPVIVTIPANLAPINFGPLTATTNEDQTLTFTGLTKISVFDADTTNLTVTLSAQHGVLTLSGTTGLNFSGGDGTGDVTMTFSGTQADINAALDGMTFKPDENYNGSAAITVQTSDGVAAVATETVNIAVAAVNDAPVLTPASPSLTISASDTQNTGLTVAVIVGNSISDVDSGALKGIAITGAVSQNGTWQYSIDNGVHWAAFGVYSAASALLLGGSDLLRFVPNGADGGSESVTYVAWDQTSGVHGQTASIGTAGGNSAFSTDSDTGHLIVTPSHAPVFDLSQYNFTSEENAPPGTIVGTVHATDADNDTLSYSITSGNSDHVFSIDGAGNIIVTGILNFESASSRDLVVTTSDPASHSDGTAVHVAIQDVSEPTSASLTSSAGLSIGGTQYGATTGFVLPGAGNVTTPGTPEDSITLGYTFNGTTSVVVADPMLHRTDFASIGTASYTADGTSYFSSILSAGHGITLSQTIALGSDASYFKTTIDIYNGSGSEISDIRFMRNIDPDQDVDAHGVYNTLNDVIQNPTRTSSIAAVVATGPVSGVQVMFVGDDGGTWRGSAFGFTNINPYDSYAFSNPQDPNGQSGDIGMSFTNQIGTLAAGGHAEISFITTANVATAGADALVGTPGADTLNGHGGGDILFGLGGADTFVFNAGFGKDTVADFAHGADILQFDSDVFASAQDVIDHLVTYANGNAVITYDAANTVTLDHVTTLSPSDIVIHNIMTS